MSARTPLRDIETRAPEAGRLRFGIKTPTRNGKQRPTAIDTWRVTSPERDQIQAIVDIYGGEVREWSDPKANPQHQWEAVTNTNTLAVWLPPDSLTTSYEHWNPAGCERRCDGEQCVYTAHGTRDEVPCVCAEEPGTPLCRAKSRLSVMLPGIPFSGVWRLETSSENFMYEAPGMIRAAQALQATTALARVNLTLTKRVHRFIGPDGKPAVNHYTVPVITFGQTPDEILQGLSSVVALEGPRPLLALDPGWTTPQQADPVWHDDEVVDAEVIEVDFPQYVEPGGWETPPPGVSVIRNPEPDGPRYIPKVREP